MSNIATMILVLGGTLAGAIVLLYFSLLPGRPEPSSKRTKEAEAATAVLAATDRKS